MYILKTIKFFLIFGIIICLSMYDVNRFDYATYVFSGMVLLSTVFLLIRPKWKFKIVFLFNYLVLLSFIISLMDLNFQALFVYVGLLHMYVQYVLMPALLLLPFTFWIVFDKGIKLISWVNIVVSIIIFFWHFTFYYNITYIDFNIYVTSNRYEDSMNHLLSMILQVLYYNLLGISFMIEDNKKIPRIDVELSKTPQVF